MNKQLIAFNILIKIFIQSQTWCEEHPLKMRPCRTESSMSDGMEMLTFEPSLEFCIKFHTVNKYWG